MTKPRLEKVRTLFIFFAHKKGYVRILTQPHSFCLCYSVVDLDKPNFGKGGKNQRPQHHTETFVTPTGFKPVTF